MNIKNESFSNFGITNYSEDFPSIAINRNIIGIQFHPEKVKKMAYNY